MDAELAEIRGSIATVLEEQCSSLALHAFIDGRDALDERLLRLSAELGWLAVSLPEAQGGFGLGAAGLAILHGELGRVAAPGAFLATSIAVETLARSSAAEDAGVSALIAEVIGGGATLAVAAKPDQSAADGQLWLLGAEGAAAALVAGSGDDLLLIDLAGAAISRMQIWDATRSMLTIAPSGCRTIATLAGARPLFDALFAIALAADSAGAARGILDRTIGYMKEREQFGRPIGSFQALKHRAADHLVHTIVADRMVWQAVDHFGGDTPAARLWPMLAKANVTDAAVRVAGDCVQLHGGVGYTMEYDPHVYLKRVRLNEMMLASNALLRDRAEQAFGEAVMGGDDVLEIA